MAKHRFTLETPEIVIIRSLLEKHRKSLRGGLGDKFTNSALEKMSRVPLVNYAHEGRSVSKGYPTKELRAGIRDI